jgi:hypothetical protein
MWQVCAMMTLAQIEEEVDRLAAKIGPAGHVLPTYGRTEDYARPHIELDQRGYHFVVVERGQELQRVTTDDLDELLYIIFEGVTFNLACDYEVRHRIPHQDCRRLLFQRQIELLSILSARWAEREAADHQRTLEAHPFQDEK